MSVFRFIFGFAFTKVPCSVLVSVLALHETITERTELENPEPTPPALVCSNRPQANQATKPKYHKAHPSTKSTFSLFVWPVADGWC
jgi:hypothetical protein